jgi:hypothetical protein
MRKIDRLNPLAREIAEALFARFPQFYRRLEVLEDGDFRIVIRAPKNSKARALCISTVEGQNTWIQFGVSNALYSISTKRELLKIVSGLTDDQLKFAITAKDGRWIETTIVRKSSDLKLRRREVGRIYSWSGTHDVEIMPSYLLRATELGKRPNKAAQRTRFARS